MYCVTTSFCHLHRERDERCRDTIFWNHCRWQSISNLRYADDIALIENNKETPEHLNENVEKVGKQLNLKLYVKKTKLMVAGSPQEEYNITILLMVKDMRKLRASSI